MARSDIYGGACGRTRTEPVHYSCRCGAVFSVEVHRSVNATRDPALGARLREGGINHVVCPACSQPAVVEVPIIYHDEEKRRLVLVLPSGARHRELEERADLLLAMARDRGFPVPPYAREPYVVFGPAGLTDKLAEIEADLAQRAALKDRSEALVRREAELVRREEELRRRLEEADRKRKPDDLPSGQVPEVLAEATTERTRPSAESAPDQRLAGTSGSMRVVIEPGKGKPRPRVTAPPVRDAAVERWIHSRTATMHLVDRSHVRLLTRLAADKLEAFVVAPVEVRVQLFRLPMYPLIVLSASRPDETLAFPFDLQRIEDRQVLGALAQSFRFILDLYDPEYLPVVQRELDAPLAANVRYILAVAEEHLGTIPVLRRYFDNALATWRGPGFDRVGRREHDLNEASFTALPAASTAALALEVVSHWSEPDNEDYLLFTRSFPLDWWRRIRSRVVTRAVELGLAVPGGLTDLAVSEGMSRSRKELTSRTLQAFVELVASGHHDLDADQVQRNWRALVAACEESGLPLDGKAQELALASLGMLPSSPVRVRTETTGPRARAVTIQPRSQGEGPMVKPADTPRPRPADEVLPPFGFDPQAKSTEELIDLLDDKESRLPAAVELGRRGEPIAVGPMFAAIRRMTRGEAVRAIPAIAAFGERAVPHLVDGLRSRQAFIRQGCALALGVLRSGDGIDPLAELLVHEPTEIWREVARAVGELGSGAVLSLTRRLAGAGPGPGPGPGNDAHERIAWAMAHVAARGGRAAVEVLAAPGGEGAAAETARQALSLAPSAKASDAEIRGDEAPKEVTVNRAFSRRFFEAMATGISVVPAERRGESDSGIRLTEAELLDPDEEFVDDEDILPT